MTPLKTFPKLVHLFSEHFGIAEEALVPNATLESLGLDSLAVIEFLFEIEDRFGLKIPDQASPPSTFGEIADLVGRSLPGPTDITAPH